MVPRGLFAGLIPVLTNHDVVICGELSSHDVGLHVHGYSPFVELWARLLRRAGPHLSLQSVVIPSSFTVVSSYLTRPREIKCTGTKILSPFSPLDVP